MAFETVVVKSLLNGFVPVLGYRQDLSPGDMMTVSLIDTTTGQPPTVGSRVWELIGRPELSVAGGAGPEPIALGTSAAVAFTVDADAGAVRKDGTYNVRCTINAGSPTEARIEAALVRLSTITIPGPLMPRTLRKLGGFEDENEDTSEPTVRQGWAMMLNRWLDAIVGIATGSLPAPAPDYLHESLTNAQGSTVTQGQIVRSSGASAFVLAEADPVSLAVPETGFVGVVEDASILNGVSGLVRTHGIAPVQFIDGLLGLASGQVVYVAETCAGPNAGMATTGPPDGSLLIPIGVLEDVLAYNPADPPGTLLPVKLQPGIANLIPTPSRTLPGGAGVTVGAVSTTLISKLLRDACTYLIDVDVTGFATDGSVALATNRVVTGAMGAGLLSFQGGQTQVHLGSVGGGSALLVAAAGNLEVSVTGVAAKTIHWTCTVKLTAARTGAWGSACVGTGGAGPGGGPSGGPSPPPF